MQMNMTACFPCSNRLARMGAAGLLLACSWTHAAEASPTSLAVLPIKLLDTSGEPADQTSQHAKRLVSLAESLASDLTRSGLYRATILPADRLRQDCPSEDAACLLKTAQAHESELIFIGVVHKSSTLIMQL